MKSLRWMMILSVLLLAIAGLWLAGENLVGIGTPRDEKAEELVKQLKDLYDQAETMEKEIRALRIAGAQYAEEEKALAGIQESIEQVRGEVAERAQVEPEVIPEAKQDPKSLPGLNWQSPKFLLAVIGLLVLVLLVLVLRNKAFGPTTKSKPLPGYTSTHRIPQPKARKPAPEPAKPAQMPRPTPAPEPEPRPRPSPPPGPRPSEAAAINEQILALHQQGVSVKDISSQLKVGQDQVSLIVRLQGKQ